MHKTIRFKKPASVLFILFLLSCPNRPSEGNNLFKTGFYSSPEDIIKKLEGKSTGYRSHFMLGVAYKRLNKYKMSIHHFANSCFTYKRNQKLKLYAHPVYRFLKGFHFKSEFYKDAVFEIASLFYLYQEYSYVIKFINLIKPDDTALYRNTVLLKAKAQVNLKNFKSAIAILKKNLRRFNDTGSQAIIHIRLASIYEKLNRYENALQEHFKVLNLNERSWQSSVALKRILAVLPKGKYSLDEEEKFLLSRSLYLNSKYTQSAWYLRPLVRKKDFPNNREALTLLIQSYIRLKKISAADLLIESFKDNNTVYRNLLKVKADELWSMRRRYDAITIYRSLVIKGEDPISQHSLKRIVLFMSARRLPGFENLCKQYTDKYPGDKSTEYFLWLLAKNELRKNNFSKSKKYLETSIEKFPSGKYSDRMRFWLYKIYKSEKRTKTAQRFVKNLIVSNPNSSYTWAVLDRIKKKYTKKNLQPAFRKALQEKNRLDIFFYNTLLFLVERDIGKRNKRLEIIFSNEINSYKTLEYEIQNLVLSSNYKNSLKDIEKYFSIGYINAINRELELLPPDKEILKDRLITLSYYGNKYANYHLAALSTLELLKFYKLREDISLLSKKTTDRLLPASYHACVEKFSKMYRIEKQLIYAVVKAESLFNHNAVSPAGAVGLMQIMPLTARGIARDLKIKKYDLKDPCTSIYFGTKYLAWLHRIFNGNFKKIVGGYNAGAGNIIKWVSKHTSEDSDLFIELIPFEETRFYILRTRKYLIQYRLINKTR